MNRIKSFFKISERGSTIRTEIAAGLTTFLTMAYIIALNPNLLTNWDTGSALWNGIFMATCLASAIGMFCVGIWANKPFGMAPGMGLNSFFAVITGNIVAATAVNYTQGYQAALCIILIEGIIFLLLSLLDKNQKVVHAIPKCIRLGIAPAIGLMLINIGLGSNVGIYSEDGNCFYVLRDFFGALMTSSLKESMGSAFNTMILTVITIFVGVFIMAALAHYKKKGAVMIGLLSASAFYWLGELIFFGINPFASLATASWIPPFEDMFETTFFKFNFGTLFDIGWVSVITLIFTYTFIDYADSVGTMIGTAQCAGMVDDNGDMPGMRESLASDAIGTLAGACTGTSTVTTFIESASGVEAGGRTGLTAIVTGLAFLACIFIAPLAAIIPAAATSAALVYVGTIMLSGLRKLEWTDISHSLPVCLMMIAMPISGSIGHGVGIALIAYTILRVCTGRAKDVSLLTYILSLLFIVKFFVAL